MEKKLKIAVSVLFLLLFGAFIAALKIVDVRAIGPAGTSVGLATLNGWTHTVLNKVVTTLLGSPEIFDKISDLSILAAAAVAGSFVFKLPDMIRAGTLSASPLPYLAGFCSALVCGLLAIRLVRLLMKKDAFVYFAYYCAAVGLLTVAVSMIKG